MNRRGFWCLSALVAVSGCARSSDDPPVPEPLRIAAASDLQTVLPKIVKQFEHDTGTKVIVTIGSSGQLAEQIKAGAPFDLFLAANEKFVTDLADKDQIIRDSVRPYAIGALVLAVHKDVKAKHEIKELADLSEPPVRHIALANPDFAPYGTAAKQALKTAGLWDKVEPKVVYAENVRQALQFVETGNAEAGFVSKATAGGSGVTVIEVDPKLYDPIIQGLGIIARSKRVNEAEAFARFLIDGPGRSIMEDHGFKMAPTDRE